MAWIGVILGESREIGGSVDDIKNPGVYRIVANSGNPFGENQTALLIVYKTSQENLVIQIASRNGKMKFRWYWVGSWTNWCSFSFDFPSFYKDYNNLSSLANALGVFKQKPQLADGGSAEYYVGDSALGFVKTESGDKACVFLKSYSRIFIIGGDTDLFADSDVAGKYCITGAGATITIKNNSGSANTFRILSVVHND